MGMIRQLGALLVLAAAVSAYPYSYPYYGGYAAYHAPIAAYHAPVYHAPVATSYHNTYRYPSYRAAYAAPVYAGYHAPIAPPTTLQSFQPTPDTTDLPRARKIKPNY